MINPYMIYEYKSRRDLDNLSYAERDLANRRAQAEADATRQQALILQANDLSGKRILANDEYGYQQALQGQSQQYQTNRDQIAANLQDSMQERQYAFQLNRDVLQAKVQESQNAIRYAQEAQARYWESMQTAARQGRELDYYRERDRLVAARELEMQHNNFVSQAAARQEQLDYNWDAMQFQAQRNKETQDSQFSHEDRIAADRHERDMAKERLSNKNAVDMHKLSFEQAKKLSEMQFKQNQEQDAQRYKDNRNTLWEKSMIDEIGRQNTYQLRNPYLNYQKQTSPWDMNDYVPGSGLYLGR